MAARTVVATANVRGSLPRDPARRALDLVLDRAPDLVGLQEWSVARLPVLRESGSAGLVPHLGVRLPRSGGARTVEYVWSSPVVGGCAIGARADRFELTGARLAVLSGPGRAGKGDRSLVLRRVAAIATYRDRQGDRPVTVVNFHLSSGVQALGRYREDRPVVVARHRAEVRRLQALVADRLARGHQVYALGDSNFDGFRLPGLTSAWEGREGEPGTLGPRRKVDDVHVHDGHASSVTLLSSDSDHKAVIVDHRAS